MQKIAGFILIIGTLWFAITCCCREFAPIFIDIPSALIVIIITIGYMLAISLPGDWRNLGKFIAGAPLKGMSFPNGISQENARNMCTLLIGGARAAIISGFIGTIIGFIVMLMNMGDIDSIFPAIAVAMITIVYGIIISEFILMPMYRIAARRYNL